MGSPPFHQAVSHAHFRQDLAVPQHEPGSRVVVVEAAVDVALPVVTIVLAVATVQEELAVWLAAALLAATSDL